MENIEIVKKALLEQGWIYNVGFLFHEKQNLTITDIVVKESIVSSSIILYKAKLEKDKKRKEIERLASIKNSGEMYFAIFYIIFLITGLIASYIYG